MTAQPRSRAWLVVAVCLPVAALAPACSSASTPAPAPSTTSAPAQPTDAPSSAAASPGSKESTAPSAPPTTPTPGSVEQTVPPVAQSTQKPVKLEGTSRFHKGLDVRVSDVGSKKVSAELPGEVSGNAVLFTVTVKNGSSKVVDLNSLVVNVLDAKEVPASRITTSPAKAMPNAVAARGSARGRYVFVVPKGARKSISVEVSLAPEDPVLVFRGSAG